MKMKILLGVIVMLLSFNLIGQEEAKFLEGRVSYITPQNIYVKFQSTNIIKIGDTLYHTQNNILLPVLIVNQKSSTSCVGSTLSDANVKLDDILVYKIKIIPELAKSEPSEALPQSLQEKDFSTEEIEPNVISKEPKNIESIRGRISSSSYSNFINGQDPKHRLLHRLSLNLSNINNSKFSVETYINFRQNIDPNKENDNVFRIYNLAVKYDIDSTFSIMAGRKINNKVSSLGAIDGLQAEKLFKKFYVGIIAGFRPDIYDFNFNSKLLEYGSYFGHISDHKKINSQSTLGILEQRNLNQIDRRYAYFQHSSTINNKLNIFTSIELDLYNKINEISSLDFRLTNFYISGRYRFNNKLNVSLSYDSRKRIIYYETLRTEIERLLEEDDSRQGIRFNINVKPFKYISSGISFSERFQVNNLNKSRNINGYLSFSKLPIGGRFALNYNLNTSLYLMSKIGSANYSRSMMKNKLNIDLYYRNVDYMYLNNETKIIQNYFGGGFTYRFSKKIMFNFLGEISTTYGTQNYRLNTKLNYRI